MEILSGTVAVTYFVVFLIFHTAILGVIFGFDGTKLRATLITSLILGAVALIGVDFINTPYWVALPPFIFFVIFLVIPTIIGCITKLMFG